MLLVNAFTLLVNVFILAEYELNVVFCTKAFVLKLPVSIVISNVFPLPLVNRITLTPFSEAVTIASDALIVKLEADVLRLVIDVLALLVNEFILLVKLNILLVKAFVLPV
jgi:hypothetical protein